METQLPPPPPQPRKTGLFVGIVVALVVVCLCVAVIAGVIAFRDQIPLVSGLFATPTPEGIPYDNASLGIHLVAPLNWYIYDEETGLVVVATSQSAIESDTTNPSDGFAAILRDADINAGMYTEADLASPENMLEALLAIGEIGLTDVIELDRQTGIVVAGYPAASVTYSYQGDSFRQVNYVYFIESGSLPTTVLFTTSEAYLEIYRSTFDALLHSLTFDN